MASDKVGLKRFPAACLVLPARRPISELAADIAGTGDALSTFMALVLPLVEENPVSSQRIES